MNMYACSTPKSADMFLLDASRIISMYEVPSLTEEGEASRSTFFLPSFKEFLEYLEVVVQLPLRHA